MTPAAPPSAARSCCRAITGYSVSKVEDEIRAFRDIKSGAKSVVKGTYAEEVAAALAHYGYSMELKESYMHLPRKERPSLWGNWMQRQRNPGSTTSWRCTWASRATGW